MPLLLTCVLRAATQVRVTPMRTEVIIRATRTQNVLGRQPRHGSCAQCYAVRSARPLPTDRCHPLLTPACTSACRCEGPPYP